MKNLNFPMLLLIAIFAILGTTIYLMYLSTAENIPRQKVATSIYPIYEVTSQIAGDKIRVVQLMPEQSNPNTFEPTLRQLQEINDSNKVFIFDRDVDDWVYGLIEDEDSEEKISIININIRENDDYYWLSPANAILISEIIFNELSELDPDNEEYFRNNYESYLLDIIEIQNESLKLYDNIGNRDVYTLTGNFDSLIQDLNLNNLGLIDLYERVEEIEDTRNQIETESESVEDEEETVETPEIIEIVEEEIEKVYVLYNIFDDIPNDIDYDDFGIVLISINPIEPGTPDSSYIELLRFNYLNLYSNLTI
jgi:zinc transport system substrate-binding protein